MALEIPYESEGFPAGSAVPNASSNLAISWDDLLWSAMTVGRPNRHYIFKHGISSIYEAIFRVSMVRMALEQRGVGGRRLRRTEAARTLDPSEKGAINYFLGLAVCKLFAAKLLNTPWLLHLDVFRPTLNPVLKGRSRPDLVGQSLTGQWIALECKGRISKPDATAKQKAKDQALRLISVNGVTPTYHIGGFAYFKNDVLNFYWRDPESDPAIKNPISLKVSEDVWRHHYAPILGLLREDPEVFDQMHEQPIRRPVPGADIEIGIFPEVLRAISQGNWDEVRESGRSARQVNGIEYRSDGISITAGQSWQRPFEEEEG